MSAPEKSLRQIHMEDQDADRRQVPPQTPGEHEGVGVVAEPLPPGEEAGGAGEETQGGPMQHQGVGPGDPHTGNPDRR